VLLCLFCCNMYFSVHQYQLVPIYLSVRSNHQLLLVDSVATSDVLTSDLMF